MVTNATNVRTALTACEYSHCRRADSKSAGVTVQLVLATFIGYVNSQKIPCLAARQRNEASERKQAVRSLRTMKVCIKVIRSAAITAMPKKDHPAYIFCTRHIATLTTAIKPKNLSSMIFLAGPMR